MNIDEVLKFASVPNDDDEDQLGQEIPGPSKKAKFENGQSSSSSSKNQPLTQEDIDKILETSEAQPMVELSEGEIKRLIGVLEKKYNKNQEMRIKYANEPTKFVESEMELFDIIKDIGCVSTRPDMYDFLAKQKIVPLFLALLSHENLDLVNAVIVLLSEMLDIEETEDIEKGLKFTEELLKNQLIQLLVQTMDRSENSEETEEYLTPVLEIFEFLCENEILTPENYPADVKIMLQWLLRKIKSKPVFSASKLFASEILAVNLQMHEKNKTILNQLKGVDILLRVISYYKRHDPESDEEEELMTNLFNTLCASLQNSVENRQSFLDDEGLELMNLILKERRNPESETHVRLQALKVINHCFSIESEDELLIRFSNKYIEILGLRVLMPLFQKPSSILSAKSRRKPKSIAEVEEHSIAIIVVLFRNCNPDNVLRLLHKFIESDFIKAERLVELYCKYTETVNTNDEQLQKEGHNLSNREIREYLLPRRLVEGLFVLQLVCHVILTVCSPNESKGRSEEFTQQIKDKIFKLLKMNPNYRGTFVEHIKCICKELALEKNEEDAKNLNEMINQF